MNHQIIGDEEIGRYGQRKHNFFQFILLWLQEIIFIFHTNSLKKNVHKYYC